VLRFCLALAAVACLAACRKAPSPILDSDLGWCIPPGALIVGGVDLRQLRTSPLYANLPPAARDAIEPLRDASYAVVASDGERFVVAARGRFAQPPAGTTMAAPDLALAGSPDFVSAAVAQHHTRRTGAPALLAHAGARPLWIVASGSANLPLGGNARNLNRLLHFTEYTTANATLDSRPVVEITGVCSGVEQARQLEETVRAFISLGERRFRSAVQIRRDGARVEATLEVEPAEIPRLF